MAINSPHELLELLQQSRLLSPEQLDDVRDSMLLTDDVTKLLDMLVERDILTEWQKVQLLAGRTGFFIGNYVLLDLLGRGGMGSVFLGRHTTMNRRCAVKVVSKKVGKDPDSLEQFLTEARAIAALDHPNIVQAYDVDKENDHFYIVMEYVEGQSLEEIIEYEGVLDCESAVDCIRQAALGLAHAHGRNMVHCDIKPSNLLVNEQGVIKILDMGMARLIGDSGISSASDTKNTDRILGTVDYMAPEQAVSAPTFDYRADIYSLGCTLFALLIGRPPFDEGSLTQRILKHQTQPPPNLSQLRSGVPADLAAICMKMMAKDPSDRYQTAEEVANLLANWKMPEQVVSETPVQEPEGPPPLPVPDSFDENVFGGADAVAGPTIETRRRRKKNFWENERILLPILGIIVTIVIGLLVFLIASSSLKDGPEPSNAGATVESSESGEPKDTESSEIEVPVDTTGVDVKPPESGTEPPKDTTSKPPISGKPSQPGPSTPIKPPRIKPPKTRPPKTPPKETQPTTPEAPANPLADLRGSVDLLRNVTDPVAGKRPLPLGYLPLGDDTDLATSLQLRLIGGKTALLQYTFKITKTSSNPLPEWAIYLVDLRDNIELKVAQIWIEKDNNLMFRWLDLDPKVPAEALRACALEMIIGKNTHRMQFCTPNQADPLRILLLNNVTYYQVTPPVMPALDAIRLELTEYDGPFEVTYAPSSVLKVDEQIDVILKSKKGKKAKTLPTLTLNFEYKIKGSAAQVLVKCLYTKPDVFRGERRIILSMQNRKVFEKFIADLSKRIIILKNSHAKRPSNAKEKEIRKLEAEYERLKNLWLLYNDLKITPNSLSIPEDFNGVGIFHVEEYIETDQGKIKLLETIKSSETENK